VTVTFFLSDAHAARKKMSNRTTNKWSLFIP
jgi:hypothetical protein